MSDIDERLEEEILHAFRKSFDSQQAGINANFLMDIQREIERLRADFAAVTEERDMMREVIKGINAMLEISCETLERPTYDSLEVGQRHNPLSQKEIIQRLTETCLFVRADLSKLMDEARAALEGVTEPASPWRDIESAPKDGTPILCVKQGSGFQPEILHFEGGVFGWLTDDMGFGCHPNRQPTHWMPLPEPPR